MKYNKIFLFLFSFFLFAGISNAQSEKIIEKAKDKVSKLNEKLIAQGNEFALTHEQMEQIQQIYQDGLARINDVRKSSTSKEEAKELQKPIRKEMNKNVSRNILTKKQKKALKTGKSKE